MNPVFFSKKIPSVQKILSLSSLNFKNIKSDSLVGLNFNKSFIIQKQNKNSNKNKQSSQYKKVLVICDKRFQSSPLLKNWRKNKQIKFYYVKSGELSKSLKQLPQHIQKINSLLSDFDKKEILFIGLGGGSIIDLTGFLASIYKRGLPAVFIPSTWLSALDSAHGGKNALNFKSIKNLLGTYHFPKAVFIVEELLSQNPKALEQQAYGELLKMAFIKGGSFYKKLKQSVFIKEKTHKNSNQFNINPKTFIEQYLKEAIKSKMAIVKKDPFETKGERKKLNLGHTVGHILEAILDLPHGLAILRALLFSLNWSYHQGFMSKKAYEEMKKLILLKPMTENLNKIKAKQISLKEFKHYLRQDKKHKTGFKIDFIFIAKPGKVFIQTVSESDLIQEARRQALF